MDKKDKQLNLLLACLDDVLESLEDWSTSNKDFCLDEIISLKEQTEAIRDQRWKLGVTQ